MIICVFILGRWMKEWKQNQTNAYNFLFLDSFSLLLVCNCYIFQIRGLAWPAVLIGWVAQSARSTTTTLYIFIVGCDLLVLCSIFLPAGHHGHFCVGIWSYLGRLYCVLLYLLRQLLYRPFYSSNTILF